MDVVTFSINSSAPMSVKANSADYNHNISNQSQRNNLTTTVRRNTQFEPFSSNICRFSRIQSADL